MAQKRNRFGLTPKQDQFAREFPADNNATQAAIRAGYSKKTAGSAAWRLLQKVDVQRAITHYAKEAQDAAGLNAQWVITRLMDNAERCRQSVPVLNKKGEPTGLFTFEPAASNKALELLGKHLRLFVERTENITPEVQQFLDNIVAALDEEIEDPQLRARIIARLVHEPTG